MADDASELEISTDELIKLSVNTERPSSIRTKMLELIEKSKANLDSSETDSLKIRKEEADRELAELQSKLDAPHRAYQNYLKALEEWEVRGKDIVGTDEDPDSLTGLQASLRELEAVPQQVDEQRLKQVEIARQILAEKMEEAEVYRVLYQPVQQFISTHVLAKDKFKLEFRAELVEKDFVKSFLSLLSQSRKGSFMGLDEGRARAEELVSVTNWNNADSVSAFLNHVDVALHTDLREEKAPALQLKTQLVSGKKPEHVFDFLYGLEYVRPRYVLRWEDKDLSMLSPGERGTLLLVFYLLIDKGDMPLVIDQPEGNLDNHTVAKMLVDCIKEARNRRQVFIVTHNPNLAVVCDANQVIHASMDKEADHQVTYTAGALENVSMSQFITDVLEGTRWAFGVRGGKYKVAEELSS